MPDRFTCPTCGEELPPGSPRDLCPRCLLGIALGSEPGGGLAELTVSFEPGSASVLATLAEAVGGLPRVLLPDPDADGQAAPGPVVAPDSPEVPGAAPSRPSGRYQLLGEIARGGMGAVLKGRDADLGRDLAVKVL